MQNIIETKNLNFSYSKNEPLIKNLNLTIERGQIYGYLGPNGAGKTTSIRILLGLLQAGSGEIKIFGNKLEDNRNEIMKNIGALVEDPSFYYHISGRENLKIFCNYRNINHSRIDEVLQIVNLSSAGKKAVKKYSTGMKQRLGIALALLPDPELIILDEPTNGLDPKGMVEIRELLISLNKDHNKTIFLSSHLLNEVEKVCTRVGIINNGELIYQGAVDDLIKIGTNNLIVEFSTSNNESAGKNLSLKGYVINSHINGTLKINLENKSQISSVIDHLRQSDLEIYKVNILNNLEDLFITMTEKL